MSLSRRAMVVAAVGFAVLVSSVMLPDGAQDVAGLETAVAAPPPPLHVSVPTRPYVPAH